MRFQIYSGETLIGQSNLDQLDPSMGIASGDFLPSGNYQNVQPVFYLYIEAATNVAGQTSEILEHYYQERDNLNLTVRLSNAEVIPTQFVHIEDFSAELNEIAVTAAVRDYQTFSRYFEQEPMP